MVLPGLDTDLDADSWELIGGRQDAAGRDIEPPAVGHPQFAMQALLRRIGIAREEVIALAVPAVARPRALRLRGAAAGRAPPTAGSELATSDFPTRIEGALATLAVIEAANAEEEALAIAVALRETLETPDKTAALVTPDRALARRVLAALARWNVAVDNSGGDALADTPAGMFARLAAEAALGGLAAGARCSPCSSIR